MNASIPEKPKRVLAEDIYMAIKEDILGVDILPGAILDEVQLMSRFGVSRTPIREAIRRQRRGREFEQVHPGVV